MILVLYSRSKSWVEPFRQRLEIGGFRTLDLDGTLGGTEELVSLAMKQWGDDFRVRLVRDKIDPLTNYIITGVRHVAEVAALNQIRATGVLQRDIPLSSEERGFLDQLGIPVEVVKRSDSDDEATVASVLAVAKRLPRVSWDDYFMAIAHIVATRGDCLKRRVAAIIVKDRRIVATGYNGTPRGTVNCGDGGCPRCASLGPSGTGLGECLCSHGEENAITQAAYHGISVKGATVYCTTSPCLLCTKMIINSGISEVVYNASYPLGGRSLELLREASVIVRQS